ncbi:MAG: hypothetical protein ACRDFS_13540 [Chloroflexota bacterium]
MKMRKSGFRGAIAGLLVAGGLLAGFGAPLASAHWGACVDDPIVWLSNGTKVQVSAVTQVDPSMVTNAVFTLHVPAGVSATQVVDTGNTAESVDVVADSGSGYQADAVVSTADGESYPVSLTVHLVDRGSTWATGSGITNSVVSATVSDS